ncbi:MAG: hypothetical protein J6M55_00675 [Paludibacteraceae bacterium]|nr:hypothetical protein [Paludibacteraceae bacterium]
MKKFFTLILALAAVVAVNAATKVTFDFSDASAYGYANPAKASYTQVPTDAVLTQDGVTMTISYTTGNGFRFFSNSNTGVVNLRGYVNSTFVLAAPAGKKIAAVAIDGTNVTKAYLSGDITGTSWSSTDGAASLTTNVIKSTVQINTMEVTLIEEGEVPPTQETVKVNVAGAITAGMALDSAKTSSEVYEVTGFVVNSQSYNAEYGNQIWYMADDAANAAAQEFEAYGCTVSENNTVMQVLDGDKVTLTGKITKYYDKNNKKFIIEIKNGTAVFVSKVEGDHAIGGQQETDPTVTPELPEGVLNCAGVKTLAATASDPTAESKTVEVADVKVRGYVISVYAANNGTQSAWIADDKSAKAGEVQGYNLKISEEVAKGDYVHMEGKLAKFFKAADNIILEVVNGTMAKVAADGTVTPVDPTPVQLDTITVAKALEIGRALDSAAVTPNQYVIKGYVSSIETPYDPEHKNETFWMVDEKGGRAASNAAGAFEVYRGKPDTEKEIGLDAYVFVTAKIQKFKGTTIETAGNVTVQVVEQGVAEVLDTITVAQALAIGKELTESNKDNSYPSEKRYAIKGYVSSIVERYSSYGNETFWITDTKGSRTNDKEVAFEVYRGKPNTGAEVGLDAYVMIVCKIKNYQGTIENDGTNVPVEVLEQGELKIDTITVAQAIEKTQALAAGAVSEEYYAVKAYIADVKEAYSTQYKNISLFLSDDPTATQSDFSCYHAKIDAADVEKAVHGAYVIVTGQLDNNSHGLQMASGASIEFAEAPKVQRITVAQALELGNALAAGAKTAERYEVVGYVASILEEYEEGVQSFIMAEEATATTGSFYIGNASIAAPGAVAHDYVGVVGFIENDGKYILITNGQATINPAEGIEHININAPKAQKVLMDGVIYIVRDGKIFNLQGAQVR